MAFTYSFYFLDGVQAVVRARRVSGRAWVLRMETTSRVNDATATSPVLGRTMPTAATANLSWCGTTTRKSATGSAPPAVSSACSFKTGRIRQWVHLFLIDFNYFRPFMLVRLFFFFSNSFIKVAHFSKTGFLVSPLKRQYIIQYNVFHMRCCISISDFI